jgi:hypothetical protein
MSRHRWILLAVLLAAGLLIALSWYAVARNTSGNDPVALESSPSPTFDPTEGTEPEPPATPDPTPEPTATAGQEVPPATVSEDVAQRIHSFYAAWSAQNRTDLRQYFTDDRYTDQRSLNSALFTGFDLRGNPGGPTLFETEPVSDSFKGYEILSAQQSGSGWVVTVREQRRSANGQDKVITTRQTWQQQAGTWKIDEYNKVGSNGKYDGFFTP